MVNRKFSTTKRKREKFARNASTKIWEGERKVEEMLLNQDKKNEEKSSLYIESEILFKCLSWAMWNLKQYTIQVCTLSNVGLKFIFFQTFTHCLLCSNNYISFSWTYPYHDMYCNNFIQFPPCYQETLDLLITFEMQLKMLRSFVAFYAF